MARSKASARGLQRQIFVVGVEGKFREECLNGRWFLTLDDARETIESWRIDYN